MTTWKVLVAAAVVFVVAGTLPVAGVESPNRGKPVPPEYFGMATSTDDWPAVPIGLWRMPAAWARLEKEKGTWEFKKLDELVDRGESHHVQLIMGLGFTPTWASTHPEKDCPVGPGACWEARDMSDWRNYIRTVAERYKGRIHYYVVWNEPTEPAFYRSSVDALVKLSEVAFDTLKEVDRTNQVISPSPVGSSGVPWMDQFLKKGGAKYVNIIGFHFYFAPVPPESLISEVNDIHKVMHNSHVAWKPIWDTENGWGGKQLDAQTQAAYVARVLILDWVAGVERVVWYQWGNPAVPLPLVTEDKKTPNEAGTAFATVEKWMLGAVLDSCDADDVPAWGKASQSMWTCDLQRGNQAGKVVWNPDGDAAFTVPVSWPVRYMHYISGKSVALPANRRITIGIQPILLDSSR